MHKTIRWTLILTVSVLFIATILLSAAGAAQKLNDRVIEVPGSSILLELWEGRLDNGEIAPFYGISLNGQSRVRTVQVSYELGLRYARFDPLEWVPTVAPVLAADTDVHLFIVQFFTQPVEEFERDISALGGTVRHYVAQLAYLVEMSEAVRTQVQALPYVRWVGPYQPAYRLEEFMLENLDRAEQAYPLQRYNIMVLAPDQKNTVASRIAALGGIVNRADAGKRLLEATLTPEQLFAVVRWDEVLFVDRWSPYETDMNIAREIGGADFIETVAGYAGAGVRGEVYDNGFNFIHQDFASRPLIRHGMAGTNYHGASTSGICFGDGTGQPLARGMLPKGQGIVADYNYTPMTGPARYTHTGELVQAPYYAVFQTASVGSYRTTQYTNISADTDEALFDFDIVHCQSQSNAGDQMSRPQAWAKNIISGGGVYHYNTLSKSDDCWCRGASIGPASDGRIKPTFTHFYDWVYTTYCCLFNSYTTTMGGTSAATPIICGHVGLFFQMWAEGIFGNQVDPRGTVFDNRSHMTTAKAMLVNTASQYPFTGPSHDKTRMHQGWGMPDLERLYTLREKIYVIDETDVLLPFEVGQHSVEVEAGEPELKVTMTYADPPGNPAVQSQHRINDLTLKVISPSNTVYYGNNGLLDGVWSTPGGDPDTKNTVECVFIENPEPGEWTVEVHADEVVQDSHVESPELDADYALVVSGVIPRILSIELVPDNPPVVVPQGGSFGYTGTLTNNTDEPQTVDIWVMADVPGMGMYGPLKQFNDVQLSPSQVLSSHFNQVVPNLAPVGDGYLYIAYVGDYPSTVIHSSSFPVEVIPGALTKAGENGWVLTGSFLEGDLLDLPSEFTLLSNYPNPFNARTVIDYQLPVGSSVRLEVYNLLGEKVVTLVDEEQEAGYRSVTWDAS
ncbi:MAG: S8 family serine peptidase, partial [Candidatus Zixiibacteriota bacterium]